MDFMHDALADGRLVRVLTLIDTYTRECLALIAQPRFTGEHVASVLQDLSATRPRPQRITVDNGTEFTSRALDAWAYWNHVQLDFGRQLNPRVEVNSSPAPTACFLLRLMDQDRGDRPGAVLFGRWL